MKVCIYGAGAIGGYLGVEMARAGADVSLVARGAHLEAMRENGVKLLINGEERVAKVRASDNPAELGPQDYVFISLKAHSVPGVVERMRPLLGNDTSVVTAVNGVPYWYFYKHGGALEGRTLESVDPGGKQWDVLRPERAIGCIVYPATEVVEPGVIQHIYGDKFPLGEPSGETTDRITRLSELMTSAGLRAPIVNNIRDEMWLKLWGNLCFNPISALTNATLEVIAGDPDTRAVAKAMMLEAQTIATRLGVTFRVDVERRINGAGAVGAHKTSMLQDLERGRPMEIDPLVTVVQEMGRMVDVPTPTLDVVLALVRQRAATAGIGDHLTVPPLTAADLRAADLHAASGQVAARH
ncbi:2-dehydropantoate 2-reductase [Azorhizobium oxalatiphilum]|uniref:2-dehydropantoate 2-reductase n=1 Tax=Azorhizobium oxalatiphilum TaxID=980631 RepID=A0A917CHN2_9HYPH|nr:2-dehydropantoate 2-reductase [Azorhizobium oxalatiphilum]GGF88109.1 2-dehydropantoate 2-reductase [Azorhizobium oxalatiphilum]